jgi:hypothetical protein
MFGEMQLAERAGFEPTIRFPVYTPSSVRLKPLGTAARGKIPTHGTGNKPAHGGG